MFVRSRILCQSRFCRQLRARWALVGAPHTRRAPMNPTLLPKIFDALQRSPNRPTFKDTTTEVAPLCMMMRCVRSTGSRRCRYCGARGRPPGDIDALATLLVRLGDFAVANAGRFRSLDLNPIIVKPAGQGVVAVDLAVEGTE